MSDRYEDYLAVVADSPNLTYQRKQQKLGQENKSKSAKYYQPEPN
jgi:hypothetical protein